MSSSRKILMATIAGILLGIFLGERVSFLSWVSTAYIRLLQMTVLPYVTVSLIAGIGSLKLDQARVLGVKVGLILVLIWSLALGTALLVPLAFPALETASFFSTTLVEPDEPFDFISLYIPSNPFSSMANGVVPAVVLFSVILGVALMGVPEKRQLIDVLSVAGKGLSQVARLISKLTPIGLFAIAAYTAGTVKFDELQRLQIYLVAYGLTALLLALWVLPGLVSTFTPIGYRQIFSAVQDALITAFFVADLFIVLPILMERSRALLEDHVATAPEARSLPEIIIPAGFNFPHAGKVLSLSFILFAGWFANSDLGIEQYPELAFVGLFTFFGSLNVAVPYLLDLFRIPADTFHLFLAAGVINSRFGTLVAAVHTVVLGLLGACAVTGALRFSARRIVRYAVVTVILGLVVIGGTRTFFSTFARPDYNTDKVVAGMQLLSAPQSSVVHRDPPTSRSGFDPSRSQLDLIRENGVLRVGYLEDSLPYVYFNSAGDLVGFDVEMAHALARELGVSLVFVPVDRKPEKVREQLAGAYCDLVMSGLIITAERAGEFLFSTSYLDETLAFVVPDHRRRDFVDWETIRKLKGVRIGVPAIPAFTEKVKSDAPQAKILSFRESGEVFGNQSPKFDAILLPAERGSVWTLIHPQYCVVVPQPEIIKIPLAYLIARQDQALANVVNTWIELKKRDGTITALYEHWILGRNAAPKRPRWSVVSDLLHWTE